jgi:hypothetical protein
MVSWQASLTHSTGSMKQRALWKADTMALNQTTGQKLNYAILPDLNCNFKMNDILITNLNQ